MGLVKSHIAPDRYYVYAMLCQDGDGPLYVKFGRSCDIERRMTELRHGSPIPGRWFLYVETGGPLAQGNLERGLHKRFKARRTRGEWFRFDAYSEEDKKEFRDGCRIVYSMVTLGELRWKRIHIPSLERKMEQRKNARFHSKSKAQIDALRRRKQNAAELEVYRDR